MIATVEHLVAAAFDDGEVLSVDAVDGDPLLYFASRYRQLAD